MMSNIIGGWAGKVLRVNLTTNTISYDPIEKYYDYIGGMGIGYKILWDGHKDNIKAIDPENIIVFSAGQGNRMSYKIVISNKLPTSTL